LDAFLYFPILFLETGIPHESSGDEEVQAIED